MTAWEGVPFDPLESVQEFLEGMSYEETSEFSIVQVSEGEPRTEGRHQEVPDVRKIKAEHDEEDRTVECTIVFLHFQHNAERNGEKVVARIGELKDIGQEGGCDFFHHHRRVSQKQHIVQPHEEMIYIRRVQGVDKSAETVKDEDDGHRGEYQIISPSGQHVFVFYEDKQCLKAYEGGVQHHQHGGAVDPLMKNSGDREQQGQKRQIQ